MTRRHRAALLALLALSAAGLLAPAAGEIQGAAAWVRVKNLLTPGSCATAGPCDLAAGTTVGGSPIGGGGAPTTADYLVGTANGSLSAEIVVGTSPGGELGGTWASPTIDSGVVDFSELSGSATDSQIPNTITVDLATTATTANAGDSATAFFSSGTVEDARIDGAGEEDEIDLTDLRDSGTNPCTGGQSVRRNAGDTAFECFTPSSSSVNSVEVIVDFGTAFSYDASTVVTGQTWVTATTEIVCAPTLVATADRVEGNDDALLEEINVAAHSRVVGTGFTVRAASRTGAFGKFAIHCVGV